MKSPANGFKLSTLAMAVTMAVPAVTVPSIAVGQAALEEVIVTSRRREESLQDIPVTVTALGEQEIARATILDLRDVGRLVPNMQIYSAGSGSGSAIYLRGVGSSTISAAFDPAVALNIDGVPLSASRMIVAGQFDMRQIEVLKGPQSLYFGRSATAGVVSVLTNDPTDELELMLRGGIQPEHDGTRYEAMVSGPLGDKFGARLALSGYDQDEFRENTFPQTPIEIIPGEPISASSDWRGRESTDARLTLTWDVSETFAAKAKIYYGEYEDDGPSGNANITCPQGGMQETNTLFVWPAAFANCDVDESLAIPDVSVTFSPDPNYRTAGDWNNGKPYTDQESTLTSLELDWAVTDDIDLTSVTAYLNLENDTLEVYDYAWGNGASHAYNSYEMWSQEFRLETAFDGPINFSGGFYYADIEQEFITGQNGVNAGITGPDTGIIDGNGVVLQEPTGNRYDWDKEHYTDTESWSVFGALYWDITEDLTLTAGVRYSEDDRDGEIRIEYMHSFLYNVLGFLPPGTVIKDGLDFDDDEITPEVSLNWAYSDDINLFVAYKTGYKPGGFDNSALPSATLGSGDVSALLYESETGEGVEGGIKSTLMDGSVRLNATAFYYVYDDLQIQLFNSNIIQFDTFNAGELTTQGAEAELLWLPGIEGLTVRAALAYTDAEYTDEFINTEGDDLDGQTPARTADWAGNVGVTYERPIFGDWMLGLSADARYSDEYPLQDVIGTEDEDSFWIYDASVRLFSSDNKYELAVIGRNLSDEVVRFSNQSRPFACTATGNPDAPCAPLRNAELDQIGTSSMGLQYTVQFTYRY